ncbi:hypothetical protein VTK56DRAFT_9138 [Thermocarpiscus australiensis]
MWDLTALMSIKRSPARRGKQDTKTELLDPNYNMDKATADTGTRATESTTGDGEEKVRASPVAKKFAQIRPADYRASHDLLRNLDKQDDTRAWQFIFPALLLQYCRMLGRDGVALFFRRITTPGHHCREVFEKNVAEEIPADPGNGEAGCQAAGRCRRGRCSSANSVASSWPKRLGSH